MAKICVIVPVYKAEAYLDRCVSSILGQSFGDFQLILVDDGSPDGCGSVCDGYAREDSRIHVIHQENAGLSAARNAGLDWMAAHSDCQWVTFIDSDDWVHPQMLEKLLDAAQGLDTAISICAYGETGGEEPWQEAILPPQAWHPKALYLQRYVDATIACAKLYRRDCFEKMRFPRGKYHEDEFVTYRLLFSQEQVALIPSPLYAYYYNPQSITNSAWSARRLDAWEAYEQQLAFFSQLGDEELIQFRYREYIDSGKLQLQAAQAAPKHLIRRMKQQLRSLIRRAWKRGYVDFWYDYDLLEQLAPVQTRLYRFWLDKK